MSTYTPKPYLNKNNNYHPPPNNNKHTKSEIITPDGEVKGRIPIVEDVLTNMTFGGDDLKTLYVAAGKTLFTTRVEIPGWVVHRRNGS